MQLSGTAGPDGTQYKRAITITNNSGSTLTDYQIYFTLDTSSLISAGKMQPNCPDIRFHDSDDSTNITNYWVENCGAGGSATSKIWVKVPSIPPAGTTIYLYYGSVSATTQSSTASTFISEISGLQSAWNMDESAWTNDCLTNSVNDTSGNGNNAKSCPSSTGPTGGNTGKFNKGGTFSGSSQYLEAVDSPSLKTFTSQLTFEAWIYPTSVTDHSYHTIFAKQYSPGFWFGLYGNTTQIQIWLNGSARVSSHALVQLNQWNHVVGSFNSGTLSIYVNGALDTTITGIGSTLSVGSDTFRIGMDREGGIPNYFFTGTLDDLRVYNTALSSADVTNLFNNNGYTTTNNPNKVLIRKYAYISGQTTGSEGISSSVGSESVALSSSGTWESPTNSNVIDTVWNGGWGDGTSGSTAFSATVASVGANNSITFWMKTAATTGGLSSATYEPVATASAGTTVTVTKAQFDALGLGTGTNRYIQVKAAFAQTSGTNPQLDKFTIYYLSDNTAPETNASGILAYVANGGSSISTGGWTGSATPYFSWTAGADSQSGLKGYCLYLGADPNGDPATAKGLLGTSPVSTTGSTCQFIVSGTSIDLSVSGYIGTALTSGNDPYYFNIKAIDNGNNIDASAVSFNFKLDNIAPTNVAYTSCAGGNFSNVVDMNFSWPTSGTSVSSDSNSGLLGWQYQINSSTGTWQGTTHSSGLNLDYIPATASAYTLVSSRDSSAITSGTNIIYFRSVDTVGNNSSSSTIRTCNLSYGGAAPTFPGDGIVTVTPASAGSNSFALSWPVATPTNGKTITHYYYMVNVSPPSTLATLQGTSTTYIDNGTSLTVAATALANVTKGTNTVYVVAIDNASIPNYSPSNYVKGTFTLNSTSPDPVQSLVASDSSIKDKSQWNVTLTWAAPSYQGAGNLTYLVYRSTDDNTFTKVGSTSGLSYVDNTPSSILYYYYIVSRDGASAASANSSTVSLTPTGRYTSAPTLQTNPSAGSITTNSVTITWSTDRSSDSKVQYGTTSGSYYTTQPYVSDQVTSHSVTINNLSAGTTYYYKTQWTDSDGNTGISSEYSFSTTPSPSVSSVSAVNVGLTSAYIQFTIYYGSSATIQYGPTTSYGGSVTQNTSNSSGGVTYSVPLTGLTDGTQYHYRIVMADASSNSYNSDDYIDLVTLPRPKISTVRLAQVENTAQTTILVTWTTNTEVSSIVTYWPWGNAGAAKDAVNVTLIRGEHQMIVRGLEPKTDYLLVVKGRDKLGNEAESDSQKFTTATDTRPPQLLDLAVQGETIPPVAGSAQHSAAQLVVSWNTDKSGTSQVEFGEGTGNTYSQKTQEDTNLVTNHIVVISGLTSSQVYHLRAISVDKYGNIGNSIDTVTIAPKATDNALNLVITSLGEAFGFLGGLGK